MAPRGEHDAHAALAEAPLQGEVADLVAGRGAADAARAAGSSAAASVLSADSPPDSAVGSGRERADNKSAQMVLASPSIPGCTGMASMSDREGPGGSPAHREDRDARRGAIARDGGRQMSASGFEPVLEDR
ncbi:hypothetical protein OV079_46575 [Nannocystis pusilla]|uniref:Uncharacterized protein n=1 Tax=Nannocystis pusilla TaxID=889268 RepID=A0A9X3J1N0_9BACT|nr:hypothetical protein [Nannocystis pusilla]MCY1012882.1 hypothetical protein [Nannocystis pusilla]